MPDESRQSCFLNQMRLLKKPPEIGGTSLERVVLFFGVAPVRLAASADISRAT